MSNPVNRIVVGNVDFGLGGDGGGMIDDQDIPGNDQVAFDAMVTLLTSTGAYQSVRHSTVDEVLFPAETDMPFAAIVPGGGNEQDMFDGGILIRTVSYKLVLVLADQESMARKANLMSLELIARNTLSGVGYGGFCLPVWSKMGQAVHPKPAHPMQRVEIPGSFAYLVNGFPSRDTNPYYNPY